MELKEIFDTAEKEKWSFNKTQKVFFEYYNKLESLLFEEGYEIKNKDDLKSITKGD